MRSISPLSKMTPPLETSISSQEAGILTARKSAMMILALTMTRQVRILVTQIHSTKRVPNIEGDEVGTCARKMGVGLAEVKASFPGDLRSQSLHKRKARQLDVL